MTSVNIRRAKGLIDRNASEYNGALLRLTLHAMLDIDEAAIDSISTITTTTGTAEVQHWWVANGPYRVDTSVDDGYIAPVSFTISAVWLYRTTPGISSSTILDLNKNGTTMYTTQANRPTIAFNDADNKVACVLPDVLNVAVGDILTVDTDQIEGGTPQHWALLIEGS